LKSRKYPTDLFGNEIPAKEYLKALIVPLLCSTGTTKLENLRLILENQYVGQDRKLISKN
jgi:hypothetical protein